MEKLLNEYAEKIESVKKMIGHKIIGHKSLVEEVILCLLSGGNILLEGVPGLGKTELVKTLSAIINLKYSRIQFTPDLMPADIIGTNVLYHDENNNTLIKFEKGPVFCQLLLADEINRATPKTQSALLETMQEHTVTVSGNRYQLTEPFFVLATQNPIEMEGTYPLPEAQVDRFLFKSIVTFPDENELLEIMRTTTVNETINIENIISADELIELQKFTRDIAVPEIVYTTVAGLIRRFHPEEEKSPSIIKKYVEYGPSPRAAQAIILTAKAHSLCNKRFNSAVEDVERVIKPAIRHRILMNFEGKSKFKNSDELITAAVQEILEDLKK